MRRRNFIKALGLATAAISSATLHAHIKPKHKDRKRFFKKHFDVAIIGAGLSGLVAANELLAKGLSVAIIEARPRVGGRTHAQAVVGTENVRVDGGGQWVGPDQTAILALAQKLGIDTFKTWTQGETVYLLEGQRFLASEIPTDNDELADLYQTTTLINELAATIPLDQPWTAANASGLDSQTLDDWLNQTMTTQGGRNQIEIEINSIFSTASTELSLLWFLFYVHSAGSYQILQAYEGGAQERRFVGGAYTLSEKLAERINEHLITDCPVIGIKQNKHHVKVKTSRGHIHAKRIIIAMMPADTQKISFKPELPQQRKQLQANWTPRSGFKVHIVYDKPFWRERGLNGQAITDTEIGLVVDNSPSDGRLGILLAFVDGTALATNKDQRMKTIVDYLVTLFGNELSTPRDYIEMDWSTEPFTTGCVSALGPNILTAYGPALRKPVGRIHWAGTETSLIWNGYMEGAVRAGQQTADDVVKALHIS